MAPPLAPVWALPVALWLTAAPATANEATPLRAAAGVAAVGSTAGGGLSLDVRLVLNGGAQLGLGVSGQALRVAYFGGQTVHGAAGGEAAFILLLPTWRRSGFELDLRMSTGLRYLGDVGALAGPHGSAQRSVTELSYLAHVRLAESYQLRAGAALVVEVETTPTVAVADQMQLLTVGLGRVLYPSLLLYANVEAGGTYGFDGDNGKTVLRGSLGLRLPFGADARSPF